MKRCWKEIENMKAWIAEAERHMAKGQLWGAYKAFNALQTCAFQARSRLSYSTLRAAQDYGHAFSMKGENGKTEWGVLKMGHEIVGLTEEANPTSTRTDK